MNISVNKQIGNEIKRELPEILKDGKHFCKLTVVPAKEHKAFVAKYRKQLYALMDDMLTPDDVSTYKTYYNWFSEPERRINEAFLENQFRNPAKWDRIVPVMEFALVQVLQNMVNDAETLFYIDVDKYSREVLNNYYSHLNTDSHE